MAEQNITPIAPAFQSGFLSAARAAHCAMTALGVLDDLTDAQTAVFEQQHELFWSSLEAIERLPPTPENIRIKARGAALALAHDPDAECDAPGSYRSLSSSIISALAA